MLKFGSRRQCECCLSLSFRPDTPPFVSPDYSRECFRYIWREALYRQPLASDKTTFLRNRRGEKSIQALRHNKNLVGSRILDLLPGRITGHIDHRAVRFERTVNKAWFSRHWFRDRKLCLVRSETRRSPRSSARSRWRLRFRFRLGSEAGGVVRVVVAAEEPQVAEPIRAVTPRPVGFHRPLLAVAPRRHRIRSVRVRADQRG